MNFIKHTSKNILLLSLSVLIIICIGVFLFNVFYYSVVFRSIQINYINTLFLVFFIVLVLFFGILLDRSKRFQQQTDKSKYKLTTREKEIVLLIVGEKKNIEIANELFVELSTIKSHINNIYKKVKVKNRNEIKETFRHFNK